MSDTLDDIDLAVIAALRRDGRRSISDIATDLGVARATVRARLDRLTANGHIIGFTVQMKGDVEEDPVRAIMLIEVTGKASDQVVQRLARLGEVRAIHTTNGRWDLVAEIGTSDLATFDESLRKIRLIEGIAATETNLLLATRKRTAGAA